MQLFRVLAAAALALVALAAGQGADAAERRLALVVGESAYPVKPLATAANDAGLVAQTLQAAGFDVTGARDLDETALKQAFRDFLDKANAAGPEAVAFVYVSGYGLQLEGENYIVPVDATISRDADIPLRALRVSDYLKPLSASAAKLAVVALDVSRASPFKLTGQPLAGGLALYEPGGRTLLAYSAAPGAIAAEAQGNYGPYAHALAEMMRDGGRSLMEVFENTRLRVSETTKGAQVPWNSQRVDTDFLFFQREASAPPRKEDVARFSQPIGALGPEDGYAAAVRQDSMEGYRDYVASYPAAPYARRARAMLAVRREAMTWRRSRIIDTPDAYWSYLRRYPKGPHAWDARRRLAELRYELEPPPDFAMVDYGYPPPPPDEIIFVEQPVMYFADPFWDFPPPPPPPIYLLPPPPPDFIVLPPPVVFAQPYMLPAPQYVPIPVWQRPPPYVAPPPDNFIYMNVHNAVVVNPEENRVVVRNPDGGVISTEALTAAGAGAAVIGVGAALPNFIAKRNPAVAPAGVAPPGGPVPAVAPPGAQRPLAPLPAGTPAREPPPPGAGAGGGEAFPAGPRPGPRDAFPAGQGRASPGQEKREPRLPMGAPSESHALPAPVGADSMPAGLTRRGRRETPADAPSRAGGPRDGAGAPFMDDQPGRRLSPRGGAARPDRMRPASPMGGERPARMTPPGVGPGGPSNPFAGEDRAPSPRNARPRPTPQDDGGFGPPSGRTRGGMWGDPTGGEMRAPARMRPPPMDMPGMRDAPSGMGAPMRGVRRDYMPPRPEPMAPHYQGGAAPQMREMSAPAMRAPVMDRPPPVSLPNPMRPQPTAPPRPREEPRPRGGGFGAPPGFGGMR